MTPAPDRLPEPTGPPALPDKPSLDGLEVKWGERWEADRTYAFDRAAPRPAVFAIDTPPPTVSGALHVGHVFSFTHTDLVARFRRMQGRAVFYPMGWDDNGLPTERRVQTVFGVRCDPSLQADPDFTEPERPTDRKAPQVPVSRPDFVALCHRLTEEDEAVYEETWRRLGLSVDWSLKYTTISARARQASQRGFLRLLAQGHAYSTEAPTAWDVDFQTAVAQAEMVDREVPGAYHRLRFARADGPGAVDIQTTRPELLPACVALVAHPDDERYRPLFGTEVVTPLFNVRVPVLGHELAAPDKGTGIAMVCTFGDTTDVTWWRELGLATRTIVGRDGRLQPVPWGEPGWRSDDPDGAGRAYAELAGRTVKQAQRRIVELLDEWGAMIGAPDPIVHAVNFYERGDRPLEIVSSRQWYVRTMPLRDRLLERGRELNWHPAHMVHRYEAWVEGLNGDWNISRQRFFGVPFPVWYPLSDDGVAQHDRPLVPDEGRLPVDPSSDVPDGYRADQRGRAGGFVGDPDVMDTWATSSLTPQIAGGWEVDPDLWARVFPMQMRPQSHEIIRTWLFSTVVRAELEEGVLPWSDVAISGWVLDPDEGGKLSKSKGKGNVITPMSLLERHGTDAVRYWAASGRPGVDTVFDEAQMKVGRRLAIKVLNASRFALARLGEGSGRAGAVSSPVDLALLTGLAAVVSEATTAFEAFDYARALERTEAFFWDFCNDYVELVKGRSYREASDPDVVSAVTTLALALSVQLRLLAPFLPFVTEEVWSWWQPGSIHLAPWPHTGELPPAASNPGASTAVLDVAAEVLGAVRREKTAAKRSMRARVARLTVVGDAERLRRLEAARADVLDAGGVDELFTEVGATDIRVELADEPPDKP